MVNKSLIIVTYKILDQIMKYIIIAVITVLTTSTAFAHSGGTDANGCHAGSKPYHCH